MGHVTQTPAGGPYKTEKSAKTNQTYFDPVFPLLLLYDVSIHEDAS